MMRLWWLVLAVWGLSVGGALWRDLGPRPLQHETAHQLSASRLRELVDFIVGDGQPRPAGSQQNEIVRQRLIGYIESLGYTVETHATRHHQFRNAIFPEVPLYNLMFRLSGIEGQGPRRALMLTAHYDSSTQGPGAADDAAGVAVLLEVARRLRMESPRRDVIFLITDGEEYGLLGADRWVSEHAWAADVELVINIEARGSGGPSLMFQTSKPNRPLIRHFARHVRRPRTSSLFAEVYRMMPNDTDLTIFLHAGMKGYNFAFIGNVRNYHTPDDTVANLRLSSLQHQGDNVWQLARSLAATDPNAFQWPTGDVVYFDVLSWWVIRWPSSWSVVMSLTILLFLLAATFFPHRFGWTLSDKFSWLSVGMAFAAWLVMVTAVAASVWGMFLAVRFDGRFAHPWPDASLGLIFSLWLAAIAFTVGLVELMERWVSSMSWLFAIAWTWGALALICSYLLVGGSYLWIVPAGAFALTLAVMPASWSVKPALLAAIFASVVGLMWLPLEGLFYDALGFRLPLISALRWSYVASALAPCAALMTSAQRRWVLMALSAAWLVMTIIVFLLAR